MKILMLNAYFEPEKASSIYLTLNLIEDLSQKDNEVVLYAPVPTRGVSNEVRSYYKKEKKEEQLFNGKVKIHRISLIKEAKNVFLRAIRYLLLNFLFIIKALKTDADILFLYSTPPTQGLVGGIVKNFKKIPFVYNLQDIFPDSLENTGIASKNSFIYKIGKKIEDYTYKKADRIITISENFKTNIMNKGVPDEKIDVVYNWVDEKAVVPVKRSDNYLIKKYNLDPNLFYVVYAGNLGKSQNIDIIFQCAKQLYREKIMFIIFGSGTEENYYREKNNKMGLSNLKLFPIEPYEKVSHVYSLGDVCLVTCKKGVGKSGLPSKTWSILSAGSIPIASFDKGSELEKIINENNLGGFADAEDSEALSDEIVRFYKNQEKNKAIRENSRKFVLDNLSRNTSTRKIENILKEVVEE